MVARLTESAAPLAEAASRARTSVDAPNADPYLGLYPRRPLKRSEYHVLIEAGVFEDERVELLFGELSPMASQGRPHNRTATAFQYGLHHALLGRAAVQGQQAIVAAEESEPEPDVAVYDPADDAFDDHPRNVWLVIEVSDRSLTKDKGPKARLYALTGIPEYWLVDLQKEQVRVMRDPEDGEYRTVMTLDFHRGHTLSPARFPDVSLELDRLVPKRRSS